MIRSYESEEWKSGSTDSFWVFKRLKQKIGESEKQKHFTQQLDGKYAGFFFFFFEKQEVMLWAPSSSHTDNPLSTHKTIQTHALTQTLSLHGTQTLAIQRRVSREALSFSHTAQITVLQSLCLSMSVSVMSVCVVCVNGSIKGCL